MKNPPFYRNLKNDTHTKKLSLGYVRIMETLNFSQKFQCLGSKDFRDFLFVTLLNFS